MVEAAVGVFEVKVPVCKGAFAQHLLGEGALHVHHQLQHLVVAAAWEKDLARVQLVDDAADAPYVHGRVCKSKQKERVLSALTKVCGAYDQGHGMLHLYSDLNTCPGGL